MAAPATAVAKLADRKESATSFERLTDCQMRWMLLDVLRLSRGRFAEIPGPDQLLGNLAHEIANQVLRYLRNLTLDNALAMPLRRTAPGRTPGSAAPAPPHSS